VKLYENTNIIEFYYGDITGGSHSANESASIGIKDMTGGIGNFIEATQNSTSIIITFLTSSVHWPEVNYRFTPPVPNEMETFHKVVVSKTAGILSIQRDVKITGLD
jgi:hypothetical protein